ncbi:MAG TPA: hypothetical protein VK802_14080 [Streptosporangiaceae bacterium]|jgi:hypothetical protein|nr:hypothetical protein [Streptosporangiaceae bacterium]
MSRRLSPGMPAGDVGVGDPVVADDPHGDPQQVADVGLALPAVCGVQARRELQSLLDLFAASARKTGDFRGKPLPTCLPNWKGTSRRSRRARRLRRCSVRAGRYAWWTG